jgi:hypothetical protein
MLGRYLKIAEENLAGAASGQGVLVVSLSDCVRPNLAVLRISFRSQAGILRPFILASGDASLGLLRVGKVRLFLVSDLLAE